MRISKKLSALGAFFALALVLAGCGSSSIPSNSVATVAGNPISLKAYKHWMFVAARYQASQTAGEPTIVADDPPSFKNCIKQVRAFVPTLATSSDAVLKSDCQQVFTQFNTEVMSFLVEAYWYQADAYKQKISYSQAELMKYFDKVKKAQFKTQSAFAAYLKSSGETEQDLLFQIRVSQLYAKLLKHYEPAVTSAQIAKYYAAHKSAFGTQQSRNVHLIRTTTLAKAQAAYNALKSGQSWTTVAKTYAADAASKANGGLLTGVVNGEEELAVNRAIFAGQVKQLLGPVHGQFGYYVLQVVHITPATQQTLAKATPQIKTLLQQQAAAAAQTKVASESKKNWGARTLCRSTYSIPDCHGYKAPSTTVTPTPTTSTNTPTVTINTGATTSPTTTPTTTTPTTTTSTKTTTSTTSKSTKTTATGG